MDWRHIRRTNGVCVEIWNKSCYNRFQDSVEDNISCGYSQYNVSDELENKYGGRDDYDYFASTTDELLNAVQDNQKTIIHCHKGKSRSASVLIAALGEL